MRERSLDSRRTTHHHRPDGRLRHRRTFWHVVLPALRPPAAVLGLLTFMTTWDDFLWPYAVLNDPANPTVRLSLRALPDGYYQDMSQAGSWKVRSRRE